ncbi:MAG: type II secretion system F family protein [Gammaproteobacteria bacterium]|nr:type II secretion system F family protein [Gammaproteobacteria bacterium]
MATFEYKARSSDGRPLKGQIDAPSTDAAAEQLLGNGYTPVEIHEARQREDVGEQLKRRLGLGRPSLSELGLFTRQLYALSKAGVPIIRGMNQLASSTRNTMLREAIEAMVEDLESGRDLAGAMARHTDIFMPLYINLVRVGEESGRLDEAFLRLWEYLEREKKTSNQIKAAMRYPAFVILAVGVAIFILMAFVIPEFAKVFEQFRLELPLPTRAIIALSEFTAAYWWAVLGAIGGGIYAFRRYIDTDAGRLWWDERRLRFPVFGSIVLRATLARFSRAFAMATRSGVPLIQALSVVSRAIGNEYLGKKIVGMREGIERGESITRTAANMGVFTPLVMQMLAVGEETGQVDDMLEEVAAFYESEVDYDVGRLAELIQPVLTVAVGIIVFILALGVFLPMWDLTQIAGR